MTDPLALDPVLPARERSQLPFNDEALEHDERYRHFEAHVETVTADPDRASVFVTEWRHLSPDRREAIRDRRDSYEQRFRGLIEDGIAVGAFRQTDAALAAAFILSALNGIAAWYRPDGRLSADRIADHYVDLALRSLSEDHR